MALSENTFTLFNILIDKTVYAKLKGAVFPRHALKA
jgi:hypothetical protein